MRMTLDQAYRRFCLGWPLYAAIGGDKDGSNFPSEPPPGSEPVPGSQDGCE
jgi:hypothetical protein